MKYLRAILVSILLGYFIKASSTQLSNKGADHASSFTSQKSIQLLDTKPQDARIYPSLHPNTTSKRRLTIKNDRFYLDKKPFQIISGAIHYFRIHPTLWRDRLVRCKSLGINTVEVYIPWNVHEPYPGKFEWKGFADISRFISIAKDLNLNILVRAGPYICAEWEFGGFPWWLGRSSIHGGGTMRLRSSDPLYLHHVDLWWQSLFSELSPYKDIILMYQIENEYGFCGNDKVYLSYLAKKARELLGNEALLYTTDPAGVAAMGTLPGDEVFTTVDFGPQWFYPGEYYGAQKSLNAIGKSPPMNSEFYTGWLSHWGEKMANTSTEALKIDTGILLKWANNTGSLNFYMAHGGTNFGWWAGANVDDTSKAYMPHITSYDYHAPISEAGDYCQPGIGGECKFQAIQDAIYEYTRVQPPPIPPRPTIHSYGTLHMKKVGTLLNTNDDNNDSISHSLSLPLATGPPRHSLHPLAMEEYGQRWGLILYRIFVNQDQYSPKYIQGLTASSPHEKESIEKKVLLDIGESIHDYASVYVNGVLVGVLERTGPANLTLPPLHSLLKYRKGGSKDGVDIQIDILVQAMGRQNFGCDAFGAWDKKGLQSTHVTLNGEPLTNWLVYNFELDDLSSLPQPPVQPQHPTTTVDSKDKNDGMVGPIFYRGTLHIEGVLAINVTDAGGESHLADTYLDTNGWGKGVVLINGFHLGWYWPSKGPQMTLYVPGPILRPGANDVVFLEMEKQPEHPEARFVNEPNFYSPSVDEFRYGGGSGSGGADAGVLVKNAGDDGGSALFATV